MASDIIQNWAFTEQKTVAATISIHTRAHTPPILPKTPRISATIKSKFNFKNIFPDIVYNVKNRINFAKNREGPGPPAPLDPPLRPFVPDIPITRNLLVFVSCNEKLITK